MLPTFGSLVSVLQNWNTRSGQLYVIVTNLGPLFPFTKLQCQMWSFVSCCYKATTLEVILCVLLLLRYKVRVGPLCFIITNLKRYVTNWKKPFLHYSIQCGQSGDYCSNNNDCCSRQCFNQRCSGGGGNVSTFTLHTREGLSLSLTHTHTHTHKHTSHTRTHTHTHTHTHARTHARARPRGGKVEERGVGPLCLVVIKL